MRSDSTSHCGSERLFTVVLKFSELKLWQIQNRILSPGSQRRTCFFSPLTIFRFCKLKRLFLFFKLPSSAHLQTMQPYCGSVRCGAILFLHCAREAGKSPVMVVRGLEVGIKPSLSACSMPLIRWLASAMQWARWKVF